MKVCSKCKVEKPLDCFSKRSRSKDGLHPYCKSCSNVSSRESYRRNLDARKDQSKTYFDKNKERIKQYRDKYREENREKINAKKRLHYDLNRERLLLVAENYRNQNKDKRQKAYKEYYKNNKSSFIASNAKRKALKKSATPRWLSKDDLNSISELYVMCEMFRLYTGLTYHVDHIVPLRGKKVCGLHVPWNLQVLEEKDNLAKHNKFEED